MLNRFLKSGFWFFYACTAIVPLSEVKAQECRVIAEMVTTLFHPDPGSQSVWNVGYGQPRFDETFVSILPMPDGEVLAAGEAKNKKGGLELLLARFNARGRPEWEKHHVVSGLQKIVKILPAAEGVMVLANRQQDKMPASLWIGFFDDQGAFKKAQDVGSKEENITAKDVVAVPDNEGWMVAITTNKNIGTDRSKTSQEKTGVMILDGKGNKKSERFYTVGEKSGINGLSVSKFQDGREGYIATGSFQNDYGKNTAWVLRLNKDASLVWQKEFDRGLGAQADFSVAYGDRSILVSGEIVPADSGSIGVWLSMLDAQSGDVRWQRYYQSETKRHDYRPAGLAVNSDGVIFLLMQASLDLKKLLQSQVNKNIEQGDKISEDPNQVEDLGDYAHMLTLTPRGVTISGDAFFYGHGVEVLSLSLGARGEKLLAGHAYISDGEIVSAVEKAREEEQEEANPTPNLPQVALTEKTLKGLAMLNQKIAEGSGTEKETDSDESIPVEQAREMEGRSKNGWILMASPADKYRDPCKKEIKTLSSQE